MFLCVRLVDTSLLHRRALEANFDVAVRLRMYVARRWRADRRSSTRRDV